ncbi:hypothetical protein E2C01_051336 [Portunus trituberculatus]|uniref:Uncharacterized protein n=1 Tax=Portunus trituberculatus TaxID=210409 RepID=A0A5B7GJA5_PORTR|nr:hypothetical protein [Portunus trituberculatus]
MQENFQCKRMKSSSTHNNIHLPLGAAQPNRDLRGFMERNQSFGISYGGSQNTLGSLCTAAKAVNSRQHSLIYFARRPCVPGEEKPGNARRGDERHANEPVLKEVLANH